MWRKFVCAISVVAVSRIVLIGQNMWNLYYTINFFLIFPRYFSSVVVSSKCSSDLFYSVPS